jgi:hypothetical protein
MATKGELKLSKRSRGIVKEGQWAMLLDDGNNFYLLKSSNVLPVFFLLQSSILLDENKLTVDSRELEQRIALVAVPTTREGKNGRIPQPRFGV